MGVSLQQRCARSWISLLIICLLSLAPAIDGEYLSDLEDLYSDFIAEGESLDKRSFYPFSRLYAARGVQINDDYFNEDVKHRGQVSTRSNRGQVSTRSRSFIGKRSGASPLDQILDLSDKRDYPNVFYRMLGKPGYEESSGLEGHALVKRSSDYFNQKSSNRMNQEKRRSFIGKRIYDMEKRRSFIGKRERTDDSSLSQIDRVNDMLKERDSQLIGEGDTFESKNSRRIEKYPHTNDNLPELVNYEELKWNDKRRSFIGKRAHEELMHNLSAGGKHSSKSFQRHAQKSPEYSNLGDSNAIWNDKRRSFIGKRTYTVGNSGIRLPETKEANYASPTGDVDQENSKSAKNKEISMNALDQLIDKRRSFIGKRTSEIDEEKRRSFIGK